MRHGMVGAMKKIVLLLSVIVLALLNTQAQYLFKPGQLPASVNLYPYASVADAGQQEFSMQDVINGKAQLRFTSLAGTNPNFGFTDHHYWVKLQLHNTGDAPVTYYLDAARSVTDRADLYIARPDGTTNVQHAGDDLPFSERTLAHRQNIFRVNIAGREQAALFLHVKSDGEMLNLSLRLDSQDELLYRTYREHLLYGLFYGILAIAAITYLFFYFALGEKSFLYYILYVVFVAFMQSALDGFFHQYILPSAGWFNAKAVLVFSLASAYFLGKYVSSFLNLPEYLPMAQRIFRMIYLLIGALMLTVFFIPQAMIFCYPAVNVIGLITLVHVLVSVIILYTKKAGVDAFFSTGICFMVLGFILFILHNFSLAPNSFLSENSSKIGTGLEVIFLTLSMSNRIRTLKRDKENMHRLALQRSEEMNELKSSFMSNMSHELRTPLNAIMGMADVMLNEPADNKIKGNLEFIRYASVSLLSSVNDILDFSKIEKGELKLDEENFEPMKVLDHIRINAEKQAKDKGLQFRYIYRGNPAGVCKGDAMRLGQIVNNVLSNAIKFTLEGSVIFVIESRKEHDIVHFSLTIEDTGIGIPKDKIDSVFDSFTQESISNKRKFGGLGLGLCIVKHLVDLHGGHVEINSIVGQGTVCRISLSYPEVQQVTISSAAFPVDEYDLLHSNILVAEDNTDNQIILKAIFEQWKNTRCRIASNGSEAIALLKQEQFDLILMDLQMPVMDGYEAAGLIRQGEAGKENIGIPIMAVTADVMGETKDKVKETGMDDYLSKPIDQRQLYNKIIHLLSNAARDGVVTSR